MVEKFININTVIIYGLISTNKPNDIKYIGVTSRKPNYRFNNHIYEAKKFPNKNKRTEWICSCDFNVEQIILDEVSMDNWQYWERYWISQMRQWGYTLVNSNNGGGGLLNRDKEFSKWLSERNIGNTYRKGKKHSKETKKLMSEKAKGRENTNKGKELPKEWRDKISEALKGRVSPRKGVKVLESTLEKKRVKIIQLDLENNEIKVWDSVSEAGQTLDINIGNITSVCRGNRKTTGGYKWKYKN